MCIAFFVCGPAIPGLRFLLLFNRDEDHGRWVQAAGPWQLQAAGPGGGEPPLPAPPSCCVSWTLATLAAGQPSPPTSGMTSQACWAAGMPPGAAPGCVSATGAWPSSPISDG